MILACDCVDSNHAYVKRIGSVVNGLAKGGSSIRYVVADKGYDAEYVHVNNRERLNAEAFIFIKTIEQARIEASRVKTLGFNRGRMKFFFNNEVYGKRALVETVNSMVKRKMGDIAYGRSEASRCKEILFRCVAHNIRGLIDAKLWVHRAKY